MVQEKVLYLLEQRRGEIVTGGEIARRLGVSRTAVWKAVAALRENGNDIESAQGSGYRLTESSDGLCGRVILDHLRTRRLGRSLEILKTVSSTIGYLREKDPAAVPDGHTVLADEQTGGRGRLNRTFHSPAREGIYLSFLLRPPVPLAETPFLTLCAAVAVCRALEAACSLQADIKWVNDIYTGGKKLCGILTEASVNAELRTVDYAIVGIGVNTGNVSSEVADIAASVRTATGLRGMRNRLAAEILNRFEEVYLLYTERGGKQDILGEYAARLLFLGESVEVSGPGGSYTAVVRGIDESGGLVVERHGETLRLNAGEIRIAKEKTAK